MAMKKAQREQKTSFSKSSLGTDARSPSVRVYARVSHPAKPRLQGLIRQALLLIGATGKPHMSSEDTNMTEHFRSMLQCVTWPRLPQQRADRSAHHSCKLVSFE